MQALKRTEHYYVEHNGDCWQSVFPTYEADKSACHDTIEDALDYMVNDCHVNPALIVTLPRRVQH